MSYFIRDIASEGNLSSYHIGESSFSFLEKKEFKKNGNPKIVGWIDPTKSERIDGELPDRDNAVVLQSTENFVFTLKKGDSNGPMIRTFGYAKVGENSYVALKKMTITPVLLMLALLFLLFLGAGVLAPHANDKNDDEIELYLPVETSSNDFALEDGDAWDGELPQNGKKVETTVETITFPGYSSVWLDEEKTDVALINPDGNTVYMIYTLKKGDEILYETKGIKPGEMVTANLYELLEKGEHEVKFEMTTFDVNDYSACNSLAPNVKVICE